ncbi:EcsC family protein [Nocardioides gilvus]|uniref:EcsC family protein n=1 Tax=Nocardioides gilvus TaxID=1735589 RepID=UPI000D74E7C6|nr:EcsC family protein [Nocardioides gilvus]
MGISKKISGQVAGRLAPKVAYAAPGVTSRAVLEALDRAIDGTGPLKPAATAADKELEQHGGDVEQAIKGIIENNVRLSGLQGFVTNIGGLTTLAVAMPANIIGLAMLQCRMIAGIAHLRGHSLVDPRVRDAILAAMLGNEGVSHLVAQRKLPGAPYELATADRHDPALRQLLATEVGSFLIAKVAGKRLVTAAGRRIPVVGGVVGAGADGFSSWQAGRYAGKEFSPSARRRR